MYNCSHPPRDPAFFHPMNNGNTQRVQKPHLANEPKKTPQFLVLTLTNKVTWLERELGGKKAFASKHTKMEENRDAVNMLFFPLNSLSLVPNKSAGFTFIYYRLRGG